MKTIAVIVNEDGLTSDIFSGKEIDIYSVSRREYELRQHFLYTVDKSAGIAKMRKCLLEIANNLKNKLVSGEAIIIGSDISGIPYNIFDSLGYTIFEIDGSPKEFLCTLCAQIETRQTKINEGEMVVYTDRPVEIKKSIYYFDLKTLQIKKPGLTSMQVLKPFFKNVSFSKLDIVCDHVPLWFDREFGRLNLKYSTKREDGVFHIIVETSGKQKGEP